MGTLFAGGMLMAVVALGTIGLGVPAASLSPYWDSGQDERQSATDGEQIPAVEFSDPVVLVKTGSELDLTSITREYGLSLGKPPNLYGWDVLRVPYSRRYAAEVLRRDPRILQVSLPTPPAQSEGADYSVQLGSLPLSGYHRSALIDVLDDAGLIGVGNGQSRCTPRIEAAQPLWSQWDDALIAVDICGQERLALFVLDERGAAHLAVTINETVDMWIPPRQPSGQGVQTEKIVWGRVLGVPSGPMSPLRLSIADDVSYLTDREGVTRPLDDVLN